MNRRLPPFLGKKKICIICEGDEEYDYIGKLKSLNVWGGNYDIDPINAEGNGNIPARYQDKYQNGSYEMVLVFCDTDKKPYEQYEDIKRKINEFHGTDNAADYVVIFANPCTMQIILLHWDDVRLVSHKKNHNASTIEEVIGIKGYKAKKSQRKALCEMLNAENYGLMIERAIKLADDDTVLNSSNFTKLAEWFTQEDSCWIEEINEKLG